MYLRNTLLILHDLRNEFQYVLTISIKISVISVTALSCNFSALGSLNRYVTAVRPPSFRKFCCANGKCLINDANAYITLFLTLISCSVESIRINCCMTAPSRALIWTEGLLKRNLNNWINPIVTLRPMQMIIFICFYIQFFQNGVK